jgi:polar amino acid transport system substrate-binding protein
MSTRIPALLLLALLAAMGRATEAPLNIAVEDDAAPWSLADGSGFANDVVRAAFQAAGVEIRFNVVSYDRCKQMALSGEACACLSMSWLDEFAGKIRFSKMPLFVCRSGYFIRAGNSGLKRPKSGSLVGVTRGYEYPPALYQVVQNGVIRLQESASEEQSLRLLAAGKLDAAIVNFNETKPYALAVSSAGVSGKVRRAFNCGVMTSHIGFSLKHPRGSLAAEKFDEGYRRIASDARLRDIEKKWAGAALGPNP